MSAQKGALMLLREGLAAGSPTTVAGSRSTSIRHNREMVEITNKDSAQRRELLAAAGTKSQQIQISGIYFDGSSQDTIQGFVDADTLNDFSMIFGNGDIYEGSFQITEYERTGEYNGEETFSMTLESSGQTTYAPSP